MSGERIQADAATLHKRVCVCVCVCVRVCLQGLPAAVVERLGDWSFAGLKEIKMHFSCTFEAEDYHAALRRTLDQLGDMDAPGAVVRVRYRDGHDTASAVAEAVTTLKHLNICPNPYDPASGEHTRAHAHAHAHTHIHTHTHMYAHTHTHTHTYMRHTHRPKHTDAVKLRIEV